MNQQNDKSVKNLKSIDGVKGVLFGTAGITVMSTIAVGVAGYFVWKNREQIMSFVGKYIDLPESLTASSSDDSLTHSKSANLGRSSSMATGSMAAGSATSHRI